MFLLGVKWEKVIACFCSKKYDFDLKKGFFMFGIRSMTNHRPASVLKQVPLKPSASTLQTLSRHLFAGKELNATSRKIDLPAYILRRVSTLANGLGRGVFPINQTKWLLAQQLVGNADLATEVLQVLFQSIVDSLEEGTSFEVSSVIHDRVWNVVSKEPLQELKLVLISEVCQKILGSFCERDLEMMLFEHSNFGMIKTEKYNCELQKLYGLNQQEIKEALIDRCTLMAEPLVPVIVTAIKKEGLDLFPNTKVENP